MAATAPALAAGPRRRATTPALRALGAVGAGLVLYASFPPRTTWWLALIAFAVFGVVVHGRSVPAGFGWGGLFGLAYLLPLLVWTSTEVGALPWLALSVFEALFFGLAGAGMALVSRLPAGPVWSAAVWVGAEAVRARVPFGGFPWGRVGFGQVDGPLLPIAALGGAPLLSFVTVLAGLALGEAARRLLTRRARPAAAAPAVVALGVLLAGPLAALVPPVSRGEPERVVTVAAVQGNVPRLGLDFNAQRRAVLDNHVRATEQLASDAAAGRVPAPTLVIWPENSSDIDPLRNPDAAAQIDRAAQAVGVPLLVGAVLLNPDGTTTSNSALVWEHGAGVTDRTDKRRVQPFGEYLPWRSFFSLFSSYAERAGYFVPGEGSGLVRQAGVGVGVVICWEVAFDDLVADSVAAGASILAVPSNNATFGLSEMTYQQLAMSRLRAVEHDRAVVVATTSGVSAIIEPNGSVTSRTDQFVADVLVAPMPLRSTTTLATQLRSAPEGTVVAAGAVAVVVGYRRRTARTRDRRKDEDD